MLKTLRAISKWVQQRDESYNPPLTSGMSRVPKGEGRRKRILADEEIRAVWRIPGQYGDFVRLALLTAQRREKLTRMQWNDIKDGVWTIRTEPREKGRRLELPRVALEIIQHQPRFVGSQYVFPGRNGGRTAKFGAGQYKAHFDRLCGVEAWRIHDLRRTARSLMSRAGVQSEHAERVLGHAIGGIEGIYNRHTYDAEKANALRSLASMIERIVAPSPEKLVAIEHDMAQL
jgi:integrase